MISFSQLGLISFETGDNLGVDHTEGTIALNITTGGKLTFVNGQWETGWYHHYVNPSSTGTGLNVIAASSLIGTQNNTLVRALEKTTDTFGFVDTTTIELGNKSFMRTLLKFKYLTNIVIIEITYIQNKENVYDYDLKIYGDDRHITITDFVHDGNFAINVVAPGQWHVDTFIKDVII